MTALKVWSMDTRVEGSSEDLKIAGSEAGAICCMLTKNRYMDHEYNIREKTLPE